MVPLETIQLGHGLAASVAPGSGEKILWLHGYTINSSLWQDLWALLPGWHHIGIDLPGHGASAPWPPNPTVPELGRLFGTVALEQGVRHIIALSFGTLLALQIIIEFPQAFASLTLGAPTIGGGQQEQSVGVRYRELMQLYQQRGPGPWLTKLWMTSPPHIFTGAASYPRLWQQLVQAIDRHTWLELRTGAMRNLPFHIQPPEMLPSLPVPTLVLVGDQEMAPFKHTAELLHSHLPNCNRVILPDTWHLCMLERPDLASRFIDEHLRRHTS
jgi:pimeloyl-ACP methyl ester carboxylesterase